MKATFCHYLNMLICILVLSALCCHPLEGAIINVPIGNSIQTAIDGAADGDIIQLATGTYIEEIHVISKNLTIQGMGFSSTSIQSPPATTHLTQNFIYGGIPWWCVVMIDNQAAPTPMTVDIKDLSVSGSNQQDTIISPFYSASNRFFAIGYHNANGTVLSVATSDTRQTVNFNELAGGGILNASDIGSVTFNVMDCVVTTYQRIGIDCRGSAVTAVVSQNLVNRGYAVPPPASATAATPNGIQFSGGTEGVISANEILGNIGTQPLAAGAGILIISGSGTVVSNNTCENNDVGIFATATDQLTLDSNTIHVILGPGVPGINPNIGIDIEEPIGLSTLTSNVMNSVPNVNMQLLSTTNQPFQLQNNQFNGSQVGLLVSGGGVQGPVITMNGDAFTGTSGYYIQELQGAQGAPNDIWPSTASVSFDGLVSGSITFAQFQQILTKIFDQHNDPTLGLVLDFIPQTVPSPPSNFIGTIQKNKLLNKTEYRLISQWSPSPSVDVVAYRIYKQGRLVTTISAGSPLVFTICLSLPKAGQLYSVAAVNSNNQESARIPISIK